MGVLPCSRQLTVTKRKRETNKGGSPPATARLCFDRCGGLVLLRMASRNWSVTGLHVAPRSQTAQDTSRRLKS